MNPISSRKHSSLLAAALLVSALWVVAAEAPRVPSRPELAAGWRNARGAAPGPAVAERVQVRTAARDGGMQRLVYRFPDVELVPLGDGTVDVLMPSAEYSSQSGEPVLPLLPVRIAVPQGHEVVRVDVIPGAFRTHQLASPVRHARDPYPLSRPQDRRDTPRNAALYGRDDAYPVRPASEHSVQTKRGVAFVDLVLHPVAYHPKSGRLDVFEEIVVAVRTRATAVAPQTVAGGRDGALRARFRSERDAAVVAPLLDNPETLDTYVVESVAPKAAATPAAAGAIVPRAVPVPTLPCQAVESYEHVIITTAALANSFRSFNFESIVVLRQAQGLTSTIVTTEAILAAYPAADAAASVRDFIRDAYNTWGAGYILLGGDSGLVPIRRLHAEVGGSYIDEIPSDLYFQCLDGSFDSDGDGIWGEPTDGTDRLDGRPGMDIDLYAEVAIGRVPVATDVELSNWVQKQVLFEGDRRRATAPYLRGALMVGEHLGFGGISEYATACMDEIRDGTDAHGYRTAGFLSLDIHTNVVTLYDAPGYSWTTDELADLVNTEQFSLLNHLGHCFTDYCMKFDSAAVRSLWSNQKPAFLYTQGCYPGAFDDECIGETLLGGTTSGLFGGVFNARFGWGAYNTTDGASHRFNRWFWHAMFGELVSELGLLNQQAHERNAARIDEVAMRWCYYESNLFGDPAQMLYGVAPEVRLNREAYRSDAQAEVAVVWPAAPATQLDVQVTLTVTNELGVIGETNIVCSRVGEYGAALGRFASVPLDLSALGAVHGAFLVATWAYPPEILEDSAAIDDVPPVISNLRVVDRDGTSLTVAWDTDELATGVARAGVLLPPPVGWAEAVQNSPATSHQVRLVGLTPFTQYYLAVWAEDLAGNPATSPADPSSTDEGDYVPASTVGFETIGRYDFETSDEGWVASNINAAACWEYGQPQDYGPLDTTRCWGTILNGRYPDGANATLTSPAFTVRSTPVIRFRHWLDAQYSMDFVGVTPTPVPYGDYGQIEVLFDGVWTNVTPYADVAQGADWITGNSGGWQQVRLDLPMEFAHRTLALRFRFLSDEQRFLDGNPAGWYVDDVLVQDVPDSNLGISNCDVLDSGAGLTGDGDGFAEPGETVSLRPRLFNFGTQAVTGLAGSFVVLVAGNPSSLAVLVDGSPAPVVYGTVNPFEEVPAQGATRLALSPNLLPGTVITLLQTLTDSTGRMIESRYDLLVGSYVVIAGSVVQIAGDIPIPNAVVVAVRGDERLQGTTGPGGAFVLTGAISNGQYSVSASATGYSPATVMVTAPTNGVTIKLGTAVGFVSPASFVFQADAGGEDSAMLTVSNSVQATGELQVTPLDVVYAGATTGWLTLPTEPFALAPGQSLQLTVTASALGLPVGRYLATITLELSDPLQLTVDIPVEFNVLQDPSLAYGGFQIMNDTDLDGYLEESETGDMFVYLLNTNGLSAAFGVTGVLTPLDPRVSLTGPADLLWTYIPASSSALSDNGVGLALDPGIADGEVLPFQLDVTYPGGPTNTFFFSLVHGRYHTVMGVVEMAATPANIPVTNAVVVATATNGTEYFSLPAAPDGSYSILRVPAGNTWFRVVPPAGYPYVAPEGKNVEVVADPTVVDFLLNDYGTNAPHLVFHDVSADDTMYGDGDGAIDPGERLVVRVRVYNDGMVFAAGLNGLLDLADMGVGVGPYMTVNPAHATDIAVPDTLGPSNVPFSYTYSTLTFEVFVEPAAVAGDQQRFKLLVSDSFVPIPREWPFDFALTVAPLHAIYGNVTFANPADNTASNRAAVRVVATIDGVSSTQSPGPGAGGPYAFISIPDGASVTVAVTPPNGFVADTDYVFDPILADQGGVDFVLRQSDFTVTPPQLDETIWEGQSATNTLTLHNGSPDPIQVDLSVAYKRGRYDVVTPDDTLATLLAASAVDWATLDEDRYVSGELEIRFRDGTGWMERQEILKQHGLRALFHFQLLPACVAVPVAPNALGDAGMAPLAAALSADARILYVQPSAKVEPFALPNDPMFPEQYSLLNERQTDGTQGDDINVVPVWEEVTTGSRDIVVAVCDTGVEWTHDDLRANVWSNPLDGPGDVNGDEYPGVRGVDDDGDVERALYFFNVLTGSKDGPEFFDPRFDQEMWRDDTTLAPQPGVPGAYEVRPGSNDLPDFFEPYIVNVLPMASLLADSRFVDADGNGIPDLLEDLDDNDVIDIFHDEDGDGVVNETGIDFRDQDVMTSDYNGNGHPLITQKFVMLPWTEGRYFSVLVEQWDIATDPYLFPVSGYQLAQVDDDENGYADDIHGWDFYGWSNDVLEGDLRNNHGTHVAGTIGAVGNNGRGISGVSQQVSLMPLRLTSRGKYASFTTNARIAKAIEYALQQDVRVSNHSWGGSSGAGVLYEVMKLAERDYNHLFVVAAGNSGLDVDNARVYPAYYSTVLNNVITVAATDHDDRLATFTCWGQDSVQIAAPGVDILSTVTEERIPSLDGPATLAGTYALLSGTSMAAPHVSGAAALLWAHAPDASYESVKNALLVGSRFDPDLQGWVKSAGHLDVGRAIRALGRDWLALSTNETTVAAGGSAAVQVVFNPERNVPAGFYEAEIRASSPIGDRIVPVTLTVNEQPIARFESLRIAAETDSDGYAEPGETADFHISLHNAGHAVFLNLQGVLTPVTPGVTVTVGSSSWDVLYDGETGESLTPYRVTIPVGAPEQVEFDLTLTADGAQAQTLRIVLATARRYTLSGFVRNTLSVGVPSAIVECWGAGGGRAVTGADGSYKIHGLTNGVHKLRAIPSGYTRSATQLATVSDDNTTVGLLTVAAPLVSLSANSFDLAVQQGYVGQLALAVSNAATTAANAYAFNVEVMPRRRVGLFSDGTRLGSLVAPLRRMGFEVDHYTNNFAVVHHINPSNGVETVVQQVRYTWDDAVVFQYDFVVADLTGAQGNGRVLSEFERAAFENYLNRGGKVLFTGANPLTQPDNEGMAPLCGLAVDGRADAAVGTATASVAWNGVFATLALGDRLSVSNWVYDLAPAVDAQTLFVAGVSSKLTRHPFNPDRGGTAYLWSGNVVDSDWAGEGLWQDILRDILRNEFYQSAATQTSVPWLRVSPTSANLVNGGTTISLAINEQRRLEPGTYGAVVALVGRDKNEEVVAVPVTLTIAPPSLRAYTTGQVTDWRGQPLRGDGGSDSAMYQVIYAGADGLANLPNLANGSPKGDDLLLAVFPSGEAFARFGADVAADSGRFDALFTYPFPVGTPNARIYVRAWDGPSFESSLVYGDSTVRHTATYAAAESRDFGSWQVATIIDYLRDLNGDSIPDGWVIQYRPDLDPRAVHGPLPTNYVSTGIQVVQKNVTKDPAPRPYRVVVSKPSAKFVFALDQANSRIAIIQTNNPADKVFFGSPGKGAGQFAAPEGMAADPRAGQYRLAVADTSNNRVQLFTYDPNSGALTFERSFGTLGSGAGKLNRPAAVAFDNTGRLFVADEINNRIAVFRVSDGAWLGSFTGTGSYVLRQPKGLCVDTDLDGGVWVCDTLNNRVTLYTANGVFKRTFGSIGTGNGQFQSPVDVQVWRVGSNKRLAVADKSNNRIQILTVGGIHRLNVGSYGTLAGQLSLPHGVHPMTDEPVLCVADTQNGRIQWFKVTLDADLDGMDDFWEDLQSCLDSAVDDAGGDEDRDGLTNLAESLIGTNPCDPDTNGKGGEDGWELANRRDPLAPSETVNPPHVVGFSALPASLQVGEATTITVVYDQAIAASSAVKLTLSGGAATTVSMTRVNSTTYRYVYAVQPGDSGVVDGAVTGAYSESLPSYSQDHVVHPQPALFAVTVSESFPPFAITAITYDPISVSWQSVIGGSYNVETNASLFLPAWGLITNVTAVNAPVETAVFGPLPSPMFFRVKRVNP